MPRHRGTTRHGTASTLAPQDVYLKDCSFEAPNGPRVEGGWSPQINLDLHTAASQTAARRARWYSR